MKPDKTSRLTSVAHLCAALPFLTLYAAGADWPQWRGPAHTPSLPDARPRSDRFRCGGRECNFLAIRLKSIE